MDSPTYVDLNNGEQENMFFFLLNAYLTSRIETDCESDGDEEVNVYMAGLLHGVVDRKFLQRPPIIWPCLRRTCGARRRMADPIGPRQMSIAPTPTIG